MFGTIRRHQKWLWIVISAVTIISFVAFFSPQQQWQGGWASNQDQVGTISGRPLLRDEYVEAYREAEMQYLVSFGDWPADDRQSGMIERQARQRLVLLEKLAELDVKVSEAAVAKYIIETFRDPSDKSFRADAYKQFVELGLRRRGLRQSDFERFARHQVGIQHLVSLAGAAGKLITPQEGEAIFRQQNEEMEAEAVFVSSSNYLAQVTVDPAALATYYTNQLANYRIPEKLQVSFVKFAASNYLAEADQQLSANTNLNQIIEAAYLQRGTNAFTDANNVPLGPEAAKQKIREDFRLAAAREVAQEKAVEFANELFELPDKNNALENLAAAKGLVSEVSEPFAQYQTPSNMKVPSSFGQTVSRLTPEEPFAEQIIEGEDGAYVVALKQRIPSQVPPLQTIEERVTQDYTTSKALELARAAGRQLHQSITNGLAQGKSFDAAAAENNASPVLLPPFSRKTSTLPGIPNPGDASRLINTAFGLSPGQVSDFVNTGTGGFLVMAKKIVPVSEEKLKAELPEFLKTLRESRHYQAFEEWLQKQMETTRIVLAGDEQRASPN